MARSRLSANARLWRLRRAALARHDLRARSWLRCLVSTKPYSNLHVWSPDTPVAIRHRMLRESLRDHPDVASEQSTAVRRCSSGVCRLGSAAHDDEGDVILRHDAAQNVSHDVLGHTVGWAQTDCLS